MIMEVEESETTENTGNLTIVEGSYDVPSTVWPQTTQAISRQLHPVHMQVNLA